MYGLEASYVLPYYCSYLPPPSPADVPSYIADPVYTVIEGQPGQIQLSLDARPLPGPSEFSWSRDGVPISSSGQVTLTSDSIDWSSVNRSDGGAYMVVATNRAGSGTASFQVVVICK